MKAEGKKLKIKRKTFIDLRISRNPVQTINPPKKSTYLLLAEFSVRTVNYEPSFFHRFMAKARSARAINRWEKTRMRNLQYGPKKRG